MPKSTLEESFLATWPRLCLLNGIQPVAPEREYRFHSTRKWRFDFAWPDKRVAVEIEGGLWQGGRHGTALGMIADMQKYNAAAVAGWRVLRFADRHLKQDPQGMFETIIECMNRANHVS